MRTEITKAKTSRQLAEEIATVLFTPGFGPEAHRLALMLKQPDGCEIHAGAGWCKWAVIEQIQSILDNNLFWHLS